ncbi:MAG: FKBP-type peptidyl-prolyl cis-trans isomerase [Gemmatimonadales bacterium]
MPILARFFRLLVLALPLAACSSKSDSVTGPPDIASTTFASALGVNLAASTKTSSGLYYRDITTGAGAAAATGQHLSVRYTGYFTGGAAFDSNTSAAAPYGFTLGAGQVITGWDQGLVGMHVGGRRQLIIPPSLGYGSSTYQSIPGNSILIFNVDLISIP